MPALKKLIELPLTRPSLLGAILAVVVGVGTFMYLGDGEAGATSSDVGSVAVVVASRDIDERTRLAATDLQLVELPSTAVHPRALRSIDAAIDQFASGFIAAGEQILPHDYSEQVFGGGLAQLVPDGQRAVSVAISNATAAGGLVSPGDHIDVVAIFTADTAGRDGTAIVAENVEVLALSQIVLGEDVDESNSPTAGSSPNAVSATVTVAVSLEDAQRLVLAENFGSLRIFLRNPDDDSDSFASPVDLDSVTRS
jgi:pilus assembly protein CpaB